MPGRHWWCVMTSAGKKNSNIYLYCSHSHERKCLFLLLTLVRKILIKYLIILLFNGLIYVIFSLCLFCEGWSIARTQIFTILLIPMVMIVVTCFSRGYWMSSNSHTHSTECIPSSALIAMSKDKFFHKSELYVWIWISTLFFILQDFEVFISLPWSVMFASKKGNLFKVIQALFRETFLIIILDFFLRSKRITEKLRDEGDLFLLIYKNMKT